ncbi:LicD family protein [Parablautia intestinalis]|uniref:LicD family protein n=1 Tax=Parablautia intestinalis TaxID=2320100 RepID=UPI00256F1498|nr:LicD family protein [Parablautia intestinalis]
MMLIDKYYKKESSDKISDIDRVTGGYIKAIGRENCDDAVSVDPREEISFYLACESRSAISWYPFEREASVLEIGGDFGNIAGELCDRVSRVVIAENSLFRAQMICERYRHRENLTVYAGEVSDMEFPWAFDYIVILGLADKTGSYGASEEYYLRIFKHLRKLLKEEGKLLLAEDNLYSLSCCQQGDGSLNPQSHMEKFSKAQMVSLLGEAGFPYIKFYYPLPDYKLVGRVYSDEALPSAAEWNCLLHYDCEDQSFLASNMELFTGLTDNHLFTAFAPSFFMEAGRKDNLSQIKKTNVLFGDNYELPLLGFDWRKKGYSSLTKAVEDYRAGAVDKERAASAVLRTDQDHRVLEKVLEVELDLLKKLKEVCGRHGLTLYAMYGTLLGAVRRAGIVTGDDDIDVALKREDFDKLLTLQDEFADPYFLQTPAGDECFYGGYLKLRNGSTTALHPQNWWVNCCEGISIDIFPLDSGFSNVKKEAAKRRKIKIWQRFLYAKAYGYFPCFKDMKLLKWKAYKYIGKLFTREQLAHYLELALSETDGKDASPFGIYAHYLQDGREPQIFDKKAFDRSIRLSYEELELDAPAGWDGILRKVYGENYIDRLPWHESKQRHGFYDAQAPYQSYKPHFNGLFRPQPQEGKKVVLFGDEALFGSYFEKYGSQYVPKALVSFQAYGKKSIHGIPVQKWDAYMEGRPDLSEIYPVVCSFDIRSAIASLKAAGLNDYYVYLHSREWILLANYTFAMREFE